ncbi:ATP-binding protein [Flavobacterium dankookense]|uniref:AAA ATPase-like protein n=1 Tax=Flavobacterium dankookense TaxID=706186 RepID=A0A4R6Q6Z2_9FLAO|nr:ATP-binding protein [Flavobacterium dankookense]TDP57767.1 AAA ATPase-like protein [Flavobacterium dankookense]
MKIKQVKIENFRSYDNECTIDLNDLNVFVGKNDIGKSTILEALDIFFNENKGVVKMDKEDINKKCKDAGNTEIKISVVFSELPETLTIDSTNPTKLAEEYLLKSDGTLEIIKRFPNAGAPKIFIKANHPTNPNCCELLLKKNVDLKKLLGDIECDDKTKNAVIRKSIWNKYMDDLQLNEIEIELAKIDAKNTWEQLKNYMPLFTLFQSDRKNSDGDDEVQNPMKFAVQEILKDAELKLALEKVAKEVEKKLTEVSTKTLEKLNEMNPEIAKSLTPIIPSPESLKWSDVFKSVSIVCEEDIPINKRGSGVKRLILLNFFRAEAERRKKAENIPSIIYAIEEPETSQHPSHQKKLIEAFIELSNANRTQIILTTHSPSIVKLLEFEHLKLIKNGNEREVVNIERGDLPYPSLNEVNYLAFDESDDEYHNELYGFIESEKMLEEFKIGKETILYKKQLKNGIIEEQKILSEYIRHQIHHPENLNNIRFTNEQLNESIKQMREFIKIKI